jgi:hypothetical protein
MKPDKQSLILELFGGADGDPRRPAALAAGARALRWRRWKRRAVQTLAAVALLGVAAYSVHVRIASPPRLAVSVAPPSSPRLPYLTDDQLLAEFAKTPVGLATVGDHKVLIFPRPGDAEKYVGHFQSP